MSSYQLWLTFALIALATLFTRFITFILFPPQSTPPKALVYLGSVLPTAAMGLIVVFALKNTAILTYPYGIPEAIASLVIVVLHRWRRNTLLSILSGTIVYMVLVQTIF